MKKAKTRTYTKREKLYVVYSGSSFFEDSEVLTKQELDEQLEDGGMTDNDTVTEVLVIKKYKVIGAKQYLKEV